MRTRPKSLSGYEAKRLTPGEAVVTEVVTSKSSLRCRDGSSISDLADLLYCLFDGASFTARGTYPPG